MYGGAQVLVEAHIHPAEPTERGPQVVRSEASQASRLSQKRAECRACHRHLSVEIVRLWIYVTGIIALLCAVISALAWLKLNDIVWAPVVVLLLGVVLLVPLAELVLKNRRIAALDYYKQRLDEAIAPPEPVDLIDEFQKFFAYMDSDGGTDGRGRTQ